MKLFNFVLCLVFLFLSTYAEAQNKSQVLYRYKGDEILLFPYQVVDGSAAKSGLLEDYQEKEITVAKPAVFSKKKSKIVVNKRFQAKYPEGVVLDVCEVTVDTNSFKMLDGRPIKFPQLKGFVLGKRL